MKKLVTALALFTSVCSFTASAGFINFNDYVVNSYGGSQDKVGSSTVSLDGSTLSLTGNVWKSISDSFVVTGNTMLNFEFFSDLEGEISGIGFTDSNSISGTRTFQIAGSADYGLNDFDTYNAGDGWLSFSISVGDFYTGTFDRMFFVMDDDSGNLASNGAFRNIEVCEQGQCVATASAVAAPSTIALFGLSLLGLVGLGRKNK